MLRHPRPAHPQVAREPLPQINRCHFCPVGRRVGMTHVFESPLGTTCFVTRLWLAVGGGFAAPDSNFRSAAVFHTKILHVCGLDSSRIWCSTGEIPQTCREPLRKTRREGSRFVSCRLQNRPYIRGNHLSNTTCLTQVFFKSGEWCSELNQPY